MKPSHAVATIAILAGAGIVVLLAITMQSAEYARQVEANNTRLQEIVDTQKPVVWGAFNFEREYCEMRGHRDALAMTYSETILTNGTIYTTAVKCHLNDGKVIQYEFTNNALEWIEVGKNPMSIDELEEGTAT